MIHLGELLKGNEDKALITKKVIRTFNDHRDILYLKALANENDPVAVAKAAAEDKKKQNDDRMMKNYLTYLAAEEIKISRVNKLKLLNDWRVIMRISKIDEIRKLLSLYFQNFERDLTNKDAILQMLDKDIEEADEHYNIALTNHLIHIRQLTSLQDSRLKGLFEEFAKDIDELDLEFSEERKEINKNFREEQNEIIRMKLSIQREYDAKLEEVRRELTDLSNSQVQKINETYSRIQDNIKKIGIQDNGKFSNEMSEIRQKAEEKNKHDKDNIALLTRLEKEIAAKKKKVDKHNEELKQWKIKIKQNNEDWELKNEALKKEKEKVMESYRILKSKLISFRNNQREKLKKLVKNSWDCISKLKEYIKLSEKILKLAEICRRLETEREKILPYYENSDIIQDDIVLPEPHKILDIDPILYEEIESLKNFWKRYNKVLLDQIAIKKQKEEIEKQNEKLKYMLQQYYDGLTVNNVVMTNENPLMIIDNQNTMNYFIENKVYQTIQEASHIRMDVRKQYNFNIVQNK